MNKHAFNVPISIKNSQAIQKPLLEVTKRVRSLRLALTVGQVKTLTTLNSWQFEFLTRR